MAATVQAGKVETWNQAGAEAFRSGRLEGLVVSDLGRVRLGHPLSLAAAGLQADQVWDLASTADGRVYAATGNEGRLYVLGAARPWTVAVDVADSQVLCVVASGNGVFAGTGPGGQVIEVSDPKQGASQPDPSVRYIWDLALDGSGNLYAATGPNGQLWKRSAGGGWKLLLDSKDPHLMCVAVAPDGSVVAGSSGEGLIYRVSPEGKVAVLYDAPQKEIKTLAVAADGTIYAGTATPDTGSSTRTTSRQGSTRIRLAAWQAPAGGSATPKDAAAGENVVYRLTADGAAREVFRLKGLVNGLAWAGGRLLIGTGPEGILHELRDGEGDPTPLARLDAGPVLAVLPQPDGSVLLGCGAPGAVRRLEAGYRAEGTLISTVRDAKLVSRLGAVEWQAEVPEKTGLEVRLRTGDVGEPDETWSDWAAPGGSSEGEASSLRPGRYFQYRVRLRTEDPARTPELKSLTVRYQTLNLAPELSKVEVPDVTAGDGTARPAQVTIKWTATDPNGDDLKYDVWLRKAEWPQWVKLTGESGISEATLNWDSTSVPGGTYRVKLGASDAPSNRPDQALRSEIESEPFVVDHEAPSVAVRQLDERSLEVGLRDGQTRLVKAAYVVDGGEWTPLYPVDGLFDTGKETLKVELGKLTAGTHIVRIRTTDAAGNTGAGDLVLDTK